MKRFFLTFLIALSAGSALAAGDLMTGKAIETRIEAGDFAIRTGDGYEFPVRITLRGDGSMEGISGNGYVDRGRWWTRGDTLCHQWDGWFDGRRLCHAITADGGTPTLVRPDPKRFHPATMKLRD